MQANRKKTALSKVKVIVVATITWTTMACSHLPKSTSPQTPSDPSQALHHENSPTINHIFVQTQADYHYSLGELLSLNKDPKGAIQEFQRTLIYNPKATIVLLRLSAEHLKLGQLNEAIEYAEDAIEQDPKFEEGYLLLGGLYTSLRMYQKATNQYLKLLEINPQHLEAYLHMGALFAEQQEYKKAESIFLKIAKDPNNPQPHLPYYYLGRIYSEQIEQSKSFITKAKKAYQESLRLKANDENSMLALISLHEEGGNLQKALQLAHSFQERFGPRPLIAKYLSMVYLEQEVHDKAIVQLRYLEAFDPSDLKIKLQLALILTKQQRFREAIDTFQRILKIAPQSDKAQFYLGAIYEELGDTSSSIKHFSQIHAISSYYADAVIHMTSLYAKRQDLDQALEVIKKALSLRQDHPQLYIFYASLLSDKKNYKAAIHTLSEAQARFPNNTQVLFFLGTIFDQTGQLNLTIAHMKKVLEMDGNHARALNYLAYTYAEQNGPLEEAEKLVRRALKLQPNDAYILDTMGWVLFKKGEIAKAIHFLETAHAARPLESTVAEHLGDAYSKFKLFKKAKQMYKLAAEVAANENNEANEANENNERVHQLHTKISTLERQIQAKREPTPSTERRRPASSAQQPKRPTAPSTKQRPASSTK